MVFRTYCWFRLFYEADRRPRLAALPERRPRRNLIAPVCRAQIVAAMLEIRPCRDDAEREISLDIYNRVWPEDAVSMVEVRAWQEHMLAWTDVLAFLDGWTANRRGRWPRR